VGPFATPLTRAQLANARSECEVRKRVTRVWRVVVRMAFVLPGLFLACLTGLAAGQEMSGLDRERDRLMGRAIEDDIIVPGNQRP
jgi:hypothetical protein